MTNMRSDLDVNFGNKVEAGYKEQKKIVLVTSGQKNRFCASFSVIADSYVMALQFFRL